MPHSEAVKELIENASEVADLLEKWAGVTYKKRIARVRASVAAVEAEEPNRKTHSFRPSFSMTPEKCSFHGCGQPASAPVHQIGGKR
jgi:hypothetical protein